jgi:hypothetical protein
MSSYTAVSGGIPVKLPSGTVFPALTQEEATDLKARAKEYMQVFHFTNVSDLANLDLVLQLETVCNRWMIFLSLGEDYAGDPIPNPGALSRDLKGLSEELRHLKAGLKLDKKTRDNDESTDVAAQWMQLRIRAKEFGVMRDKQTAKAVELANHLIGLYELWERCDEQERKINKANPDDIMAWIKNEFIPQFKVIDQHFRLNQKVWIQAVGSL